MTLNKTLDPNLFSATPTLAATRDGFGEALVEIAGYNNKIVGLCGDLTESVRMGAFAKTFPKRFWNVGIAEQNMVSMGAGLALEGFIPFVATYGVFLGRAWDHIRIQVCMSDANVKLVGTHAGVTTGADGATAQALEDIAMMRSFPNLTIVSPCDFLEAKKAITTVADMTGPVYVRLSKEKMPVVTTAKTPFVLGRAEEFASGKDVTIVATGTMVHAALEAARLLEYEGTSATVFNVHTIKPLDEQAIIRSVKKTGAVVVAEEHQAAGGLGGAVAELLVRSIPAPMEQVAVNDSFGESGKADELLKKFGLTPKHIVEAALQAIKRKKQKE